MKVFFQLLVFGICINGLHAQTPLHSVRILSDKQDLVSTKDDPLLYSYNEDSKELEFSKNAESLTIDLNEELLIHVYDDNIEFIGELFILNVENNLSMIFSNKEERNMFSDFLQNL